MQTTRAEPTPGRGLYLCLCALYVSNFLDRSILSILGEAIRADLGLDDAALGAISGPAFTLVYGLLALAIGRFADRADRCRLVVVGALIWSLSCASGALTVSASQLVAARIGVALGEALATPAAISLLADLIPEQRRGFAAALFFSGAFIGAGAAAMLGGTLLSAFAAQPGIDAWRIVLVCAALPGLAGAIVLFAMTRGRHVEGVEIRDFPLAFLSGGNLVFISAAIVVVALQVTLPAHLSVPLATLTAALPYLWMRHAMPNREAFTMTLGESRFRAFVGGMAAVCFLDFAATFWLLPLALRRFEVEPAVLGNVCGVLILAGGILGTLAGGWLGDRYRERALGRLTIVVGAVLVEAVALAACIYATTVPAFIAAYGVFSIASGAWVGVAAASGLDLLPARHRAFGVAAYFWLTGLAGASLGPFVVGWTSDRIDSLSIALQVPILAVIPAVVLLVKAAKGKARAADALRAGQHQ